MKNQRAVYLLLPLVLLIWGLIGWRVWSATEEPAAGPAVSFATRQPVAAPARRGFPKLLLTYADPFRAVAGSEPVPTQAAPVLPAAGPALAAPANSASGLNLPIRPITPALPTTTTPPPSWPPITYLGVIAHAEGKAQVALLTINGEETALKIGREVQGIRLLRLFRDSVQVVRGKQQRTFYRAAL